MHRRFRIHVHFSKGMMRARGGWGWGGVVLISDLVATDVVGRKLSRGLSPPPFLPSSLSLVPCPLVTVERILPPALISVAFCGKYAKKMHGASLAFVVSASQVRRLSRWQLPTCLLVGPIYRSGS